LKTFYFNYLLLEKIFPSPEVGENQSGTIGFRNKDPMKGCSAKKPLPFAKAFFPHTLKRKQMLYGNGRTHSLHVNIR
jgi:hypothetical protein